eukprot:c14810_g1_i1.p1 GENE.c14810_g1_i1~~c14810_g1_i1.p1  ORF type:complete len:300 (+),score=139.14 c14810_g1_i1:61-960(+)
MSNNDEAWVVNKKFVRLDQNKDTKESVNAYSEPEPAKFLLRGKNYLADHKKVPSNSPAFKIEGINVFRTPQAVFHAADKIQCLKKWLSDHADNEYFLFNFVLPGPPYITVVQLYKRVLPEGADPVFDRVYRRFKTEGEAFQKDRFKFVCMVPTAPWALKMTISSLGGERPVIICNKLTSAHFQGSNYTEIDVDVSTSKVAAMLNSLVIRASSKLLVDMGCTLEGKEEDELPERLLTCVRWHYCDADQIATTLDEMGNIQSFEVSSSYISSLEETSFQTTEEGAGQEDFDENKSTSTARG